LKSGGGRHSWHLNSSGAFEKWKWDGERGESMPPGAVQFATDASKWGGGGWFEEEWVVREWSASERYLHINLLECLMVLHFCKLFDPQWSGLRVVAWCDNLVTVRAVNKGVSGSDAMNSLIRQIRLLSLEFDFELWVRHIPGLVNFIPDDLSRGVLGARVGNWSLLPDSFEYWRKRRGEFEWDAYADVNGGNSRASKWSSSDGLVTIEGGSVWAFPPPSLSDAFWKSWETWGASSITAMLPASSCAELPEGWTILREYQGSSRIFRRPVADRWVRCTCAGMPMTVIGWNADVHAMVPAC
jgi:hypothetical protein